MTEKRDRTELAPLILMAGSGLLVIGLFLLMVFLAPVVGPTVPTGQAGTPVLLKPSPTPAPLQTCDEIFKVYRPAVNVQMTCWFDGSKWIPDGESER